MEHIDWIVSFVIFVFVILAIITAIPRFLPDNLKQEEIYTSNIIYSQINEKVEKYSIYQDTNNQENIFYIEDINKGRANSSFIIDENVLFVNYLQNTNFYYYDANNQLQNPRKNIFSEKIIDENSLTNFQLNQGVVLNYKGEAYAFQETILESLGSFSDFYFEYIVEPLDMNIYFNYQDVNNYSLCSLDQNYLKLYDQNSQGHFLIDSKNIDLNENDYFINLQVFSNYDGKVNCTIENTTVENLAQSSVRNGKIILKNIEPLYIDSFKIYKNNFLEKNANRIETSNFEMEINSNTVDLNLFKERNKIGNLSLSYKDNLDYSLINNNKPGVIKNNLSKQKLIVFPNTDQLLSIVENEDVNIYISDGLEISSYDYEIEEVLSDYYLWINTDVAANSQKTIYLKKILGNQPTTGFIKNYNPSLNPDTTVTNQGNGLYRIDIDNTGGSELTNYELRIDNNSLNLSSLVDSLIITDSNYGNISNVLLENQNIYVWIKFFDNKRNLKECQVNLINEGLNIYCQNKTYISIKITDSLKNVDEKYFVENEKIITYEKVKEIKDKYIKDQDNYFLRIYNNKEKFEIGDYGYSGDFKILEKISKYFNEKGQEEIVKVLIKPN